MTDLLSRPSTAGTSGRRPGGTWHGRLAGRLGLTSGGAGVAASTASPPGRPLTVSAAIAGLAAAGTTLVTFLGLAVVGWFLADAGAHGRTTDALRVGADVWLVGHGARLTLAGAPLGIVPLLVTAVLVVAVHRFARWAALTSEPVDDDRTVVLAATILAGLYVVAAVVTCVVAADESASPSLGRTIVGSALLAGATGTLGLAGGTGRLRLWAQRVPGWVRSIAHGAAASFLLLVVAASLLVAVALLTGLNDAARMMAALELSGGDYVMYALATVALAPNAVLLGAAYLLGPGFAVGTGTVVSPALVDLGPVPAFPLLAALPDDGPAPVWALAVLAVPVAVAMAGAVLAQRSYRVPAYDSAALRGFGTGLGAAVLTTVAVLAAGGPMGTGRMADIGAPAGEVLVAALLAMGLGGLVAGTVTAWFQRR